MVRILRNLRYRAASWLIGRDTERAIYIGDRAATVIWEGPVEGVMVIGAKAGYQFDGQVRRTCFTPVSAGETET